MRSRVRIQALGYVIGWWRMGYFGTLYGYWVLLGVIRCGGGICAWGLWKGRVSQQARSVVLQIGGWVELVVPRK